MGMFGGLSLSLDCSLGSWETVGKSSGVRRFLEGMDIDHHHVCWNVRETIVVITQKRVFFLKEKHMF